MNGVGVRSLILSLLGVFVMALIACSHDSPAVATSSADPGSSIGSVAAAEIDSLILTMDELKPIVGDRLTHRDPVERKPVQRDSCDPGYEPGWAEFRRVNSTGWSNFFVLQQVAVYQNPQSASDAFKKQVEPLRGCHRGQVTTDSQTTFSWASPSDGQSYDVCAGQSRLESNVLYEIASCHLKDDLIVTKVSDAIAAKVSRAD